MSEYYSSRKNDCNGEKRKKDNCGCGTVIVSFTSAAGFPILFSSTAGNVDSTCSAALAVGSNVIFALQCLFEDGFEIVAFTANGAVNTYTLTNC